MVGVAGQARIDDRSDAFDAAEPAGQGVGVAVVAVHPGRQRAHAPLEKPGRAGIDRSSVELHHLRHAGDQLRAACDNPRDEVGVSAQVLGRRMDDRIHAVLRGTDVHRRRESHVGREDGAGGPGRPAGRLDVEDAQRGVGGKFDEDDPRARRQRGLPGRRIGRIDEGGGDPALGQFVREQRMGGAVEVAAGDHVVSRAGGGEDGHRNRGHAAGEGQTSLGSLQSGDLARDRELVGIVAVAAVQQLQAVVRAGPVKGGAAYDRLHHRAARAGLGAPRMHGVRRRSGSAAGL